MKPSEIFRKAARYMENRCYPPYACNAISFVETGCSFDQTLARKYFKEIYGKKEGHNTAGWYGDPHCSKNRNARIIALCLAAAVAKSEGK